MDNDTQLDLFEDTDTEQDWITPAPDYSHFYFMEQHFPDSAFHDSFIRILGRLALTKDTVVLQALVNTMRDIEAETVDKLLNSIITDYYKTEMKGNYRTWLSERMFLSTTMERDAREKRASDRKLSEGVQAWDRRRRSHIPSEQTIGLWQREQNEHITVLVAKVEEVLLSVCGERWMWTKILRDQDFDKAEDFSVRAGILCNECVMQPKRYKVVPLPYVLEKLHMLSQAD